MNAVCYRVVATPLGDLILTASNQALTSAHFADQAIVPRAFAHVIERPQHPLLERAASAIQRYFEGAPLGTAIPLAPAGTSFQREVWTAISNVAPGRTATYREIALALGAPRSTRAVGAATGRNPLCIFIPCHRIVGSNGALTGYAGGLERKRALLALERSSAEVRLESAA